MRSKNNEYSKQLMNFTKGLVTAVTVFSMYMVWETKNLDPLIYMIPAAFGAFGAAAGFYYSKAKKENEIKLRKKYGAEIYNDTKGEDYHA